MTLGMWLPEASRFQDSMSVALGGCGRGAAHNLGARESSLSVPKFRTSRNVAELATFLQSTGTLISFQPETSRLWSWE